LKTHSILAPWPEEENGTYDVVAVRFMTTVLNGSEWDMALKGLLALLKPGGWLQWIDFDASVTTVKGRVYQALPGVSRRACLEVAEAMVQVQSLSGREFDGCRKLESIFLAQGLDGVYEEVWNTANKEDLRESWGENGREGAKRLFEVLSSIPGSGWDKERSERVLRDVEEEVKDGKVYFSTDIYSVIGRKRVQ
jgi:hypothetical protein